MKKAPIKFELWSQACEAPSRSRLYNLEPIGVGTPEVESLSSYINRLAQAHCVTVTVLLKHELLPQIKDNKASERSKGANSGAGLPRGGGNRLARMIYGLGMTAEKWVEALQALTGRRDLGLLTFLDWRYVLPNRKLISQSVRWCPSCFDDRSAAEQPVYDQLLWKLDPITACLSHRRRLRNRCCYCRKGLNEFSGRSRPGYCSRCGYWLGADGRAELQPEDRLSEEEWQWQDWVVKNLGQLIRTSARLDYPPPEETVARSVTYYLSQQSDAGLNNLATTLGCRRDHFSNWSRGESRMQIDMLLKFCFHCGISLAQFLTEPAPSPPTQLRCASQKTPVQVVTRAGWRPKGTNREELRRAMESALEHEFPPISLRAVSKRVRLASRTLLYYEPELCRKIVDRQENYRAEIRDRARQVLEESLRREPAPSLASLFQGSDLKISMARHNFPDLCRQVVARYSDYRRGQKLELKRTLEQALLEENPPPKLDLIASRLGRCPHSLRVHFPDLCRKITKRNLEYQKERFLKRRETVISEIRETTFRLHAQGIFPSVNQVSENLPRPRNIGSNKEIVGELRKIRKELGWE
jgi:hypothetical protein